MTFVYIKAVKRKSMNEEKMYLQFRKAITLLFALINKSKKIMTYLQVMSLLCVVGKMILAGMRLFSQL